MLSRKLITLLLLPLEIFSPLFPVLQAAPDTQSPALQPKTLQNFSGVQLNCPFILTPQSTPPLPANAPIRELSIHSASSDNLTVTISAVTYNEGVNVSLEAGIAASISSISKAQGVSGPVEKITDFLIPGANAKRLSYHALRLGQELRMEALYLQKGQQLWAIQTIFPGDNQKADLVSKNILQSVTLL